MSTPDLPRTRVAPAAATGHPAVDAARPFGAPLRMSWWKPVVLVLVLPLVLVVLQVLTLQLVGVVEGSDVDGRSSRAARPGRSGGASGPVAAG